MFGVSRSFGFLVPCVLCLVPSGAAGARLLFAAALALLAGCTTNPMTGRSQFMMVSEESAISGSAAAYTGMMGDLTKKNKIIAGTDRADGIRAITNRLVAEAVRFRPDSVNWNWEVQVIDDPKTVNAFCMAGGKMAIYSGMWEKLHATDDEIAQVMGHEIGHALASHTRERMSVAMTTSIGAALVAALIAGNNSRTYGNTQMAAATAAAVAITLPNSRESESEADQIGIELAARAGFDPQAAVTLWDKMAKMDKGEGPAEFLSTHPSPENRKQALQALVPKVEPLYQMAKAGKSTADIPSFIGATSNERVIGGPSKDEYAAKLAKDPQALTFVSEDFEKFKKGQIVLTCATECAFGYQFQKGKWKEMHQKQAWRDLAIAVVRNGYYNDLTYFLLGEAAKGLELNEAAKIYYSRALEAQKVGKTCAGTFNTCEGFEISQMVTATTTSK